MNVFDKSKFSLYSFGDDRFLIGFCGGIYSLTPAFYKFLTEGTCESEQVELEMREELKMMDEIETKASDIPPMPGRTLRALCLNVTDACNLSCAYCFKHSDESSDKYMSYETAVRSLDFLLSKGSEDSVFQIDFFGGEPLLNFNMIKKFIPEAKKKARKIKFTLTTNAVLLNDEILNFLNEEKISLILSLDGDKNANDLSRKDKLGNSVWESTFANVKKAISSRSGEDYYVRGTFTPQSLDISSTCRFFIDNGIYKFSLEPAKGSGSDPWAVSENDVEKICAEYEKIMQLIAKKKVQGLPVDYFHFNIYLDAPLCSPRRLSGCGAGVEYASINPEGKIYPCHRLHIPEFEMGSVFEESPRFDIIRNKFSACSINSKSACGKCWAKFYCSGGCHADAWKNGGDINEPAPYDCALQKKRIQCSIWLAASNLKNSMR